ncbi:MAG: hypothetical protein IJ429_02440 [Lachnospiraceae bacterium]|nr:hypothetical protein [Lachnospiraceae bacterium]
MSKNFEEEYKEYLNAQAPDLWSRIEEGIDAQMALDGRELSKEDNVIPMDAKAGRNKQKKKQIRYQHYRTIVSVAACLFALIMVIPVYFLVKPSGRSNEAAADSAAPIVLTDATIKNIEAEAASESEVAAEEAATEDAVYEEAVVTQEEQPAEQDEVQDVGQLAQEEIQMEEVDAEELAAAGTDNGMSASEESLVASETEKEILPEAENESVAAGEEMLVRILSEGTEQEDGTLYTASVAGNADSSTITLFITKDMDLILEKDRNYTVTVEYTEEGSYTVIRADLTE